MSQRLSRQEYSPAELLNLLHSIVAGGSPLTAVVARTVLRLVRTTYRKRAPDSSSPLLTSREREVLKALVDGRSYKQVAADLDISIDTVRSHIRAVYGKLQVHSVAEAVSRAIRSGLV
jgi:DNA-binding NarL/FixJ family response regulator